MYLSVEPYDSKHIKVVVYNREGDKLLRPAMGGSYKRKEKCWVFPASSLLDIPLSHPAVKVHPLIAETRAKMLTSYNAVNALKALKDKLDPTSFLMQHQQVCRAIARNFARYAFFLDTGTGKTITAYSIIDENPATKWLVVCPKTIIKTAWLGDGVKFYPHIKVLPLSKNMKKEDYLELASKWGVQLPRRTNKDELVELLAKVAQVFITNTEHLGAVIPVIKRHGVTGLIFDESVKLKAPTSGITKQVTELAETLTRVYLLSGLPAPNSPIEYFSQMRIVDQGIFGDNFYRFRERFFESDYLGFKWTLKPDLEEVFAQRVARKSFVVKKKDCLDLLDPVYITYDVELGTEALKLYKQMERDRCIFLSESRVTADQKVKQLMKLRQITGGFVIDDESVSSPVHTHKLSALKEILDEQIGNQQVIIWCDFQNEVRAIEEMLGSRCVTAYGGTKDVDESIRAFIQGEAQYIVAHPKTLKYGVTFVGKDMQLGDCKYAIYYTSSYSYDDYYQSRDRIHRNGLTSQVTFIFLRCPGTVDDLVLQALQNKADLAELVEQYLKEA